LSDGLAPPHAEASKATAAIAATGQARCRHFAEECVTLALDTSFGDSIFQLDAPWRRLARPGTLTGERRSGTEPHHHMRLSAKYAFILVAVPVFLAAALSCGGDGGNSVTGKVADVVSSGIDSFSSLSVVDGEGRVWTFSGGRFPAFTPSHLLEHRLTGAQIKVTYRKEANGSLTPVALDDG
jgi:hypothetical protein